MEAFGTISAAAGLVSLGITICNGLLIYYDSYKGADETVQAMVNSVESLTKTFTILERLVSSPSLSDDAKTRVVESITSCEVGISALRKKLDKIQKSSPQQRWHERSWARVKGTLYPFKETTLIKLRERCYELRDNLSFALTTLQM